MTNKEQMATLIKRYQHLQEREQHYREMQRYYATKYTEYQDEAAKFRIADYKEMEKAFKNRQRELKHLFKMLHGITIKEGAELLGIEI